MLLHLAKHYALLLACSCCSCINQLQQHAAAMCTSTAAALQFVSAACQGITLHPAASHSSSAGAAASSLCCIAPACCVSLQRSCLRMHHANPSSPLSCHWDRTIAAVQLPRMAGCCCALFPAWSALDLRSNNSLQQAAAPSTPRYCPHALQHTSCKRCCTSPCPACSLAPCRCPYSTASSSSTAAAVHGCWLLLLMSQPKISMSTAACC